MLQDEDTRKQDSSVKCLEVMSTSDPRHWHSILEAGMLTDEVLSCYFLISKLISLKLFKITSARKY